MLLWRETSAISAPDRRVVEMRLIGEAGRSAIESQPMKAGAEPRKPGRSLLLTGKSFEHFLLQMA